jgi:hypothetical protein
MWPYEPPAGMAAAAAMLVRPVSLVENTILFRWA